MRTHCASAPLSVCPACGAASFAKQVTAAGFQLKGSGWYVTDFRDNGKKADGKSTAGNGADSPASNGSDDAGKAPAKPEASGGSEATAAPAPTATSSKAVSAAPASAATA